MSDPIKAFELEVSENIQNLKNDKVGRQMAFDWMAHVSRQGKYSYNFKWLGRPIIQFPQDIVAMQELIFETKPDLIIETGIAHGGSLIFSASMLALLDLMEPKDEGKRQVLGIDIDIRKHNKHAIEQHPLSNYIEMIEGSSIDQDVVSKVHNVAKNYQKILVCLDSNHTEEHVLNELKLYSKLVTKSSYLVVFDTVVEEFPENSFPDRPWEVGNNPMTAVNKFLSDNSNFTIEEHIDAKLQVSVAPRGYLKRIR